MVAQRKRIEGAFGAPVQREVPLEEEKDLKQAKARAPVTPIQGHDGAPSSSGGSSSGGLPSGLRQGVEAMSGMDMSGVQVHTNSSKPAEVNALAYAQGNDIHLARGQERHLAHEAWHVVQQRQGRVKPTFQMQSVAINDDAGLEREADTMGAKAARLGSQDVYGRD